MVRLRFDALVKLPPPMYHPDSTAITISIYHKGTFENGHYVVGKVQKVDYIDADKFTLLNLDEYVQDLFPVGSLIKIYTGVNNEFVKIRNDELLKTYAMKYLAKTREYPLYLEVVDESEARENAGNDNADVGRKVGHQNVEQIPDKQNDEKESVQLKNGGADFERESTPEFFARVENTEEWLAEYARRYGDIDTCDDVGLTNSAKETGNILPENAKQTVKVVPESGEEYKVPESDKNGHTISANEIEQTGLMAEYVVPKSESSEDDDWCAPENVTSSSGDDQLFEDNVYSSAEMNVVDGEIMVDEKDTAVSRENIVGSDDEVLNLGRNSADEDVEMDSFPPFKDHDIFDPVFELGQTFVNKDIFKTSVNSYAIKTRRTFPFRRSDNSRVYVRCSSRRCPFKINAIRVKKQSNASENENAFVIRELCLEHTCSESYNVKNMKTRWLAERYVAWFKSDPKRNVMGFREDVEDALSVTISSHQAYRAKVLALKMVQGDPDLQYTKLWDYAAELRKTNPGSTIILGTDDSEGELRFCKFYVCFNAMKIDWQSCRPIIGVDGCHLRGPHGGILLTAVGVDPDNVNFPIAYAVVSVENKENWTWFFTVLKSDLGLQNGEGITFISDKQKGLIHALPKIFPAAEVRFCVRHMVVNMFNAGHKGVSIKNTVWKAAKATTVAEFKDAMKILRDKFSDAANWLTDKQPHEWSRSHFLEHSRCAMLVNNCCETFNSCINDARNKPIITMLEWIREYLMKLYHKNRETAEEWSGRVCPNIVKILETHGRKAGGCRPIKASRTHFQIQCSDGKQYAVDLDARTCSCRKWQLTGVPCKHGLSAIYNDKLDELDFVAECYSVSNYRKAYGEVIMPISSHQLWGNSVFIPPLPPNFGRRAGRPTKNRRRGRDESKTRGKSKKMGPIIRKLRRFQKTIHCGHCGQPGHNALFCPGLPNSAKAKLERLQRRAFLTHEVGESSNVNAAGVTGNGEHDAMSEHNEDDQTQAILPPIQISVHQQELDIQKSVDGDIPDFTLTEETLVPGPSMFEQLQLGNPQLQTWVTRSTMSYQQIANIGRDYIANKRQKTLGLKKVNMRVPPQMNAEDVRMSQQSVCSPMIEKTILKQKGKKYLDLSANRKEGNK